MSAALLPPNSTRLERSLADAMSRFAHGQIVRTLWNADTCPASHLPWLAWACSVDDWDDMWTEAEKRQAIKDARIIHQHKGTPGAVRRALAAIGHADAEIIERSDYIRCDGTTTCDGTRTCGGKWATYAVILKSPVTVPEAYRIRRILLASDRTAVKLRRLEFAAAAFRCDGTITCDGTYSCGSVDTTMN